MKDYEQIKLGWGIGRVHFGMLRTEALQILGAPNTIDKVEYEGVRGSNDEVHGYSELNLSLIFSEEHEYRLTSITCTSPSLSLQGVHIIGSKKSELVGRLFELSIEESECKTFPQNVEQVSFGLAEMDVWFEADSAYKVEWGHHWIDENTPAWPEA